MKTSIFTILFLFGSTLLSQEQLVGNWSGLGRDEQTKAICEKADLSISQDQNVMIVHEAHFSCSGELNLDFHDLEFHIDNGLLIYKNEIVGQIHGGQAEIRLPSSAVGNLAVSLNRLEDSKTLTVSIGIGKISGNVYLTGSWTFNLQK